MDMKLVTSSQIHAVGYDPASQKLHIQFLAGKDRAPGPIYEYDGIAPEQHAALIGASSIGAHFRKHIRSNADIKFRKL